MHQAERFAALATLTGAERLETYLDIFCTGSGTQPRKSIDYARRRQRRIGSTSARRARTRLELLERRRGVSLRDRSAALLTVVHAVVTRYAKEKERRGLLDYDDLIDKALQLLANVDAAWVHFKLDLGIDHVLVDEAQDTSHKQWEIVRRLTAEFTAGAGARGVKRTMFAVGDEKQSIYSFQDAAPKEFAEMRRFFKSAHEKSEQKFLDSKFEHSFRSGATILAAVDEVFKRQDVAQSVTVGPGGFPPHIALPDTPPGLVEIWEPEKPDERKEIEGWDAPFDTVSETSPRVKLARRIARHVRKHGRRAHGALRRYFDPGAPARRIVRGDHPGAQARRGAGRRRRPPRAHRTHRGDGSDGARRSAVAAARRSGAGDRAAQSAVRIFGRRSVRDRLRPRPHAAAHGA